jgi:hypothetical protein
MFVTQTHKICCSPGWQVFCLTSQGWQLLDYFAPDERFILELWLARVNARRISSPEGEDPAAEFYATWEVS